MIAKSTKGIGSLRFAAAFCAAGILWSHPAAAEGALAIGLPSNVAKSGYASGYSYNAKTTEAAQKRAMEECHKAPTNEKARSLCKVIETFSDRCVAMSMDPKAGTPGVGWGIGDDLGAAERQALARCQATAGPSRRAACMVQKSNCDGQADAGNGCETLSGDAAIAACDEAIRKNPRSANNYTNRGYEYRNKGEFDRAVSDFNKAIELDPEDGIQQPGQRLPRQGRQRQRACRFQQGHRGQPEI